MALGTLRRRHIHADHTPWRKDSALPESTLLHEQHREIRMRVVRRVLHALWPPPLEGNWGNGRKFGLGVGLACRGDSGNRLGEVNGSWLLGRHRCRLRCLCFARGSDATRIDMSSCGGGMEQEQERTLPPSHGRAAAWRATSGSRLRCGDMHDGHHASSTGSARGRRLSRCELGSSLAVHTHNRTLRGRSGVLLWPRSRLRITIAVCNGQTSRNFRIYDHGVPCECPQR